MFDQGKNFYLKGNENFNARQKSVFTAVDKLSENNLENRYDSNELKNVDKVSVVKDKKKLKQFLGQESIFKRPDIKLKKNMKLRVPEFIKNPQKWKKYSLGDDEISDQSNQIVAMTFLKDLRERKDKIECDDEGSEELKPKFNKFINETGSDLAVNVGNDKPTFINGKTIMPEYVVGQKLAKKNKKKGVDIASKSCVKLDHLLEEE